MSLSQWAPTLSGEIDPMKWARGWRPFVRGSWRTGRVLGTGSVVEKGIRFGRVELSASLHLQCASRSGIGTVMSHGGSQAGDREGSEMSDNDSVGDPVVGRPILG